MFSKSSYLENAIKNVALICTTVYVRMRATFLFIILRQLLQSLLVHFWEDNSLRLKSVQENYP